MVAEKIETQGKRMMCELVGRESVASLREMIVLNSAE